jgi:hypothetical protein
MQENGALRARETSTLPEGRRQRKLCEIAVKRNVMRRIEEPLRV